MTDVNNSRDRDAQEEASPRAPDRKAADKEAWHVGELPFVWTILRDPSAFPDIPRKLRFTLSAGADGRLIQAPNDETRTVLSQSYRTGSVLAGMMTEDALSQPYVDDFIAFLREQELLASPSSLRVLDVGCGPGVLLKELKDVGCRVAGIEPGDHGQKAAEKYGVPVLQSFFPGEVPGGRYDLVIMTNVLEHVTEPEAVVRAVSGVLRPGGRFALSVPDCTPYASFGDLSMLTHEHWSYFTTDTLERALLAAGASDVVVRTSPRVGSIYATAQFNSGGTGTAVGSPDNAQHLLESYRQKAEAVLARTQKLVAQAMRNGRSVGVYMPSRFINALCLMEVDHGCIRFFDDNKDMQGGYFPGVAIPIEGRAALLRKPVDEMLIYSKTFGAHLRNELATSLPATTTVYTWDDIHVA